VRFLVEFFKEHLLGIAIFTLALGFLTNYLYDQAKDRGLVVNQSDAREIRGRDPETTAAAAVDECKRSHGMKFERERLDLPSSDVFRQCTWPPPSYADRDGFVEITVTREDGPGEYEATGCTVIERVRGPCRTFSIAYNITHMGDNTHLEPIRVNPVAVVDADGRTCDEWRCCSDLKQDWLLWMGGRWPERNEALVVRNAHISLSSVECR
jgi:hypothetical protein